jgi:hypothetical protein
MATNIKTVNKRGGDGNIISTTNRTRILGVHSYSSIAGVVTIGDQGQELDKIKYDSSCK